MTHTQYLFALRKHFIIHFKSREKDIIFGRLKLNEIRRVGNDDDNVFCCRLTEFLFRQ